MMADKPKLSSPEVVLIMADGSEFSVQSLNIDMLNWEQYAIKNRLPINPGGAPVTWMSYLGWSAAVREKLIPPAMTFQQFRTEMVSVAAAGGPAPAGADPTDAVPDTD